MAEFNTKPEFLYNSIMDYMVKTGGLDDRMDVMDNIARSAGVGSEYSKYQDLFYGLNALPNMAPLPTHRELQGLTLFTKPELNLSYDNISPVRSLAHLLTQDPNTSQYAVRMLLDPTTYSATTNKSQLVDGQSPYLNLLSNSLQSMSTPPDIGMNVYTSPEGIAKEVWMMPDSIAEYNGRYDITCTFNNVRGNTVLMLFHTWLLYMGALRVGPCLPHPKNRYENRMDFNTRIERFKFDVHGEKIEQWYHCGAAVPTNCSIGAGFGFNRDEAGEMENKQLSVQFACVGAVYNDPIQLLEFNIRMIRANGNLRDDLRKSHYVKAERRLLKAVNYNAYPLINLSTCSMEWWVPKDDYARLVKGL